MQLISVLFGIILGEKTKVYLVIVIQVYALLESAWHCSSKEKSSQVYPGIGTIEQRCLILLRVLSDPSIQNVSPSIGIKMKEIELGQQLLRCARKLIGCTQNSSNKIKGQCRTSVVKCSVIKALCLGLFPTPTKEMSNEGSVILSKRAISMREISWQLSFSVGTGHRTLSSVKKKRSDILEGRKEGWIMLNEDKQQTKYTNELLDAF